MKPASGSVMGAGPEGFAPAVGREAETAGNVRGGPAMTTLGLIDGNSWKIIP